LVHKLFILLHQEMPDDKKYKLAINESHFVIQLSIHSMFLQNLSSVLTLKKFAF